MGRSRLEKIYLIGLVIIFAGIVIHTPVSVGLGTLLPHYELLIKSWKEILMVLLLPIAVILVSRYKLWSRLTSDPLFWLIVSYAALHLLLAAILRGEAAQLAAGLAIDLRYVLFFSLVYVALLIMPTARLLMLRIGIIGAIIVVGFATLQLFLPHDVLKYIGYSRDTIAPYLTVDKNYDFIRVNSTLRGPNPLGAYTMIVLGVFTAALVYAKLKLRERKEMILSSLLLACTLVALWISYSRSAWVGAAITVVVVLGLTVMRKMSRHVWIVSAVVVFALAGGLMAARGSEFVSNVILHENPDGGSPVSSNEEHAESLAVGLTRFISQPLGGGIGSTGSASLHSDEPLVIENQYLFVGHETGWIGLLLFIGIFGTILMRLWQKRREWLSLGILASGIGLALVGILQPVWADDTVSIVWWGLAAIAIATGGKNERHTTKQKTT